MARIVLDPGRPRNTARATRCAPHASHAASPRTRTRSLPPSTRPKCRVQPSGPSRLRALGAPPASQSGLQLPARHREGTVIGRRLKVARGCRRVTMALDGVLACVRSGCGVRHRLRARPAGAGPRPAESAPRSRRRSDTRRALGHRHAALALDGRLLAPLRPCRAGPVAAAVGWHAESSAYWTDGRGAGARRGGAPRDRRLGPRRTPGRGGGRPRYTGRNRARDVRERPVARGTAAPGSDVRDRLDHEDVHRHPAGVARRPGRRQPGRHAGGAAAGRRRPAGGTAADHPRPPSRRTPRASRGRRPTWAGPACSCAWSSA